MDEIAAQTEPLRLVVNHFRRSLEDEHDRDHLPSAREQVETLTAVLSIACSHYLNLPAPADTVHTSGEASLIRDWLRYATDVLDHFRKSLSQSFSETDAPRFAEKFLAIGGDWDKFLETLDASLDRNQLIRNDTPWNLDNVLSSEGVGG